MGGRIPKGFKEVKLIYFMKYELVFENFIILEYNFNKNDYYILSILKINKNLK